MTRHEILQLVQEIYFRPPSNNYTTALLEKLHEALPNSVISDLIFHNPQELTPEQVVDEAMRREAEYVGTTRED